MTQTTQSQKGWTSYQAAKVLFGNLDGSVTTLFSDALKKKSDFFLWHGYLPQDRKGTYWIPGLFASEKLGEIVERISKKKEISLEAAQDRVRLYHAGLTRDQVDLCVAAPVELDHLGYDEQTAVYESITRDTGLRWALQVFSGGKSIHSYLLFSEPVKAAHPLREDVQKLLIVLAQGDSRITDPGRLLRCPGEFRGSRRSQPIIHLDESAHYPIEEIHRRLSALAQSKGIKDLDKAFRACQEAERLLEGGQKDLSQKVRESFGLDPMLLVEARAALAKTPHGRIIDSTAVPRVIKRTSKDVVYVDPNTIIESQAGVVQSLEEWGSGTYEAERVISPCCDPQKSPAGNLWSRGDTTSIPRIWCHRHKQTIFPEGSSPDLESVVLDPEKKGGKKFDIIRIFGGEGKNKLHRGKFLPTLALERRVTYIKAPQGTGKSQYMSWLAKRAKGDVIAIAHRRTLVSGLARRCGLPNYMDSPAGKLNGSMTVCLNSVPRVSLLSIGEGSTVSRREIDLLIVDEITQLRRAIYSGTMNGWESLRAASHLAKVFRCARQIVVGDADLDSSTIDWVRRLSGAPIDGSMEEYREIPIKAIDWRYTYSLTPSRAEFDRLMLGFWKQGERLAIPVFGNADAHKIAKMLISERPLANVQVVTRDEALDLRKQIESPNTWIQNENIDALIYSPSLGTGIDIHLENWFDRILGVFHSGVLLAQDARQMLHRVRNPRHSEIIAWVSPGGQRKSVDPVWVKDHLLTMSAKLEKRMARKNGDLTEYVLTRWDDDRNPIPRDEEHFETYVEVLLEERQWGGVGGRIGQGLPLFLMREGLAWEYLDMETVEMPLPEPEDVKELTRSAREFAQLERAERILSAPDMCIQDARELRDPQSSSDLLAQEKAVIKDHYGSIDESIILRDKRGKHRARCRNFAWVLLVLGQKENQLLEMEKRDVDRGSIAHLKHRWAKTKTTIKILKWMGVDVVQLAQCKEDIEIDSSRWKAAMIKVLGMRAFLVELGIPIPEDALLRPGRLLSSLLKTLGLKWNRRRKRVNGGRVFTYTISADYIEQMWNDSERYYNKIAKGFSGEGSDNDDLGDIVDKLLN